MHWLIGVGYLSVLLCIAAGIASSVELRKRLTEVRVRTGRDDRR